MPFRSSIRVVAALFICSCVVLSHPVLLVADQADRQTPLVRAVSACKASVVNLRGRKTIKSEESRNGEVKHVNGMGTGVVIDSRGYILTNYHVVQGVRKIQVTTSDRTKTTGRLIAHDPETDLALLKINVDQSLPVIPIGTSSDLMLAETVAAVGNAYGYEHTVTVGIISQLGRTVQVNDEQIYRNLIQTDTPINPGNSGGPLINLDGKMIGINVAVRQGAQGIAFAIPANDALEVASRLMAQHVAEASELQLGLSFATQYVRHQPELRVQEVDSDCAAYRAGVRSGDKIMHVNGEPVSRSLDLQSALLAMRPSSELTLNLDKQGKTQQVSFRLDDTGPALNINQDSWRLIGLKLKPATQSEMVGRHPNYQRGLKVTRVRKNSPADEEGIMAGDILVAMHGWKTESMENLQYILEQPDILGRSNFMFYILREKEPFWGKLRIASKVR